MIIDNAIFIEWANIKNRSNHYVMAMNLMRSCLKNCLFIS